MADTLDKKLKSCSCVSVAWGVFNLKISTYLKPEHMPGHTCMSLMGHWLYVNIKAGVVLAVYTSTVNNYTLFFFFTRGPVLYSKPILKTP